MRTPVDRDDSIVVIVFLEEDDLVRRLQHLPAVVAAHEGETWARRQAPDARVGELRSLEPIISNVVSLRQRPRLERYPSVWRVGHHDRPRLRHKCGLVVELPLCPLAPVPPGIRSPELDHLVFPF